MCVADFRCGWCASSNTCIAGDNVGPYENNSCSSFSIGSCGAVCASSIHDRMDNIVWNTKFWQPIDNLDADGVDSKSHTYGTKNAIATIQGAKLTVSNYSFNNTLTSGRVWANPQFGYSYGRFSVKVKPSTTENVRTEFELRAIDLDSSVAFGWEGNSNQVFIHSVTLNVQSSTGFDMGNNMAEYTILYMPTYVSFFANGTLIRFVVLVWLFFFFF